MAGRTQNDSYDAHLTDLKNDLNALQRDMRQLIDKVGMSAGDAANGAAHQVRDAANGAAHQVRDAANGAAHQVESWADDGAKSVRQMIRAQPLAAIALSMSAGAVLSLILRRL